MNFFINLAAKSLISTLMTSLFIVSMPSIAEEIKIERRIEIKAEQGKNVTIHVDEDDHQNMIKLSLKELSDNSAIEDKLAVLDTETIEKVKKALAQVRDALENANNKIEIHQFVADVEDIELIEELAELEQLDELLSDEHMGFLLEKAHQLKDGKFIRKYEVDGDERIIVIDGSDSHVMSSDSEFFASSDDGEHKMKHFRLGRDNIVLKGHVDAILKMINHGQFTDEELDKLQQALDNKR